MLGQCLSKDKPVEDDNGYRLSYMNEAVHSWLRGDVTCSHMWFGVHLRNLAILLVSDHCLILRGTRNRSLLSVDNIRQLQIKIWGLIWVNWPSSELYNLCSTFYFFVCTSYRHLSFSKRCKAKYGYLLLWTGVARKIRQPDTAQRNRVLRKSRKKSRRAHMAAKLRCEGDHKTFISRRKVKYEFYRSKSSGLN